MKKSREVEIYSPTYRRKIPRPFNLPSFPLSPPNLNDEDDDEKYLESELAWEKLAPLLPQSPRSRRLSHILSLPTVDWLEGPISLSGHYNIFNGKIIYIFGERHDLKRVNGLDPCNAVNNPEYKMIYHFLNEWVNNGMFKVDLFYEGTHATKLESQHDMYNIHDINELINKRIEHYTPKKWTKNINKTLKYSLDEITLRSLDSPNYHWIDIRAFNTYDNAFRPKLIEINLNLIKLKNYFEDNKIDKKDFIINTYDQFVEYNLTMIEVFSYVDDLKHSKNIILTMSSYMVDSEVKDFFIDNSYEENEDNKTVELFTSSYLNTLTDGALLNFTSNVIDVSILESKNEDAIDEMITRIYEEILKLYNITENNLDKLVFINSTFMDAYMLLSLNQEQYKNVIIYAGDSHCNMYRQFLDLNGYDILDFQYNESGCLDLRRFKQPLFIPSL